MLLMKAHVFSPKDRVSTIGFLDTFKLASNTDGIHKEAEMWVLRHHFIETLENTSRNRLCATDKSHLIAASVRNIEDRFSKLLQSYLKEVNYFLK